jgi:hypothetical protein
MSERRSHHLTEEQLAHYQDGQLPPREASHLDACSECTRRLTDLQAAAEAYREYLGSVRGPALLPPQPWRPLDSLIAQHETSRSPRPWRWWLIPVLGTAVCLALTIGLVLRRSSQQPVFPAEELLARSANMESSPSHRMVSLHLHGRSLIRPAVLVSDSAERDPELAHLAVLFTEARYNWQEPLSARSFQSWRSKLREKRDSVTVIHARGPETAYRIRTDTGSGILRSAALTLRAKDLHPTQGTFQFEGEEPLEMEESDASPPRVASRQPRPVAKPEPVPMEIPASPSEALHVLAALNEIGADAGEPIEVSEDAKHQVIVRAMGLSSDRLEQVAAAIKELPHVKLSVDAGGDTSGTASPHRPPAGTPEPSSSGIPAPLRQRFEERLGGAIALQEMTDRVLDTSGLAIARAHAIDVLATKFPPQIESALMEGDRQLLLHLRQVHIAALRDLAARLQRNLNLLLPPAGSPETLPSLDWQEQAPELLATAQHVDDALNRLLAGSYSDPAGEALLNRLAGQLARLHKMIELQNEHAR